MKTGTWIFIASLFLITQTGRCINRRWPLHRMKHYSTAGEKKTLVRAAMHSNVPSGKWRPENRSNSSGPHLWGSCSILRSSPEASAFLVQWPLRGKEPVGEFVTELFLFSRDQVCTLVSWHLIPVSDCRFSKLLPAVCERTSAQQIFFSVGAQKSYHCYLALVFPQTPPHQCPAASVSRLWCDRCWKGSWLSTLRRPGEALSPVRRLVCPSLLPPPTRGRDWAKWWADGGCYFLLLPSSAHTAVGREPSGWLPI